MISRNDNNNTNENIDTIQFDEKDIDNLEVRNIFSKISDNENKDKKSIGWEINQVSKLTLRHSIAYIGKFLFLNIIVLFPSCILSETITGMIISSLTFLGCLLFDQIISFINLKDFDFIKMKKFCICVFVYIMILWFINIDLLFFQLPITDNFNLNKFKITIGLILFSSTVSVLTEAIMNIPQQVMPTSQEKTNK